MASEKFGILLEKLLSKTQTKDIRWYETASESAFRIALGGGLIRVEHDSDIDNDEYYAAYLQDRKGRTLDQIGPLYQLDPTRDLLSQLFEAARISALGVDDILEKMVADAELGKTQPLPITALPPIPPKKKM